MARRHFAKGVVSKTNVPFEFWMDELKANGESVIPANQTNRIAKTILRKADPKQYLLSHATIVASVDAYAPKGVKIGKQFNRGVQIDVKYPEYRIKPDCHSIINSNGDAWNRPLLLSTYRTFVGAQNFCFVPDTKVLMADGTLRAIQDITVGDEVIGGSGLPRKVVHKHVRDYEGEVRLVYTGHNKQPIVSTPNHPFARLDKESCVKCGKKLPIHSRPSSYKNRLERTMCTDCGRKNKRPANNVIEARRVRADELEPRAILFAPIPKISGSINSSDDKNRIARLMGFYLAEGTLIKQGNRYNGIIFTVGTKETNFIQQILDCVRALEPGNLPVVSLSRHSEHCTRIVVYSARLANILFDNCGVYSHSKKLSLSWINTASPEEIKHLIGSYISGDADVHSITQRIRLCSISLDLLQQVQFLASTVKWSGFIVDHSVKLGSSNTVMFADGTTHEIISRHQAHILHFDVQSSKEICEYATDHKKQTRNIAAGDLKFYEDKKITFVNKIEVDKYKGKVFNLEVETDHSYVINGNVQVFNCEHIQLPELSKGFIVDAIARDIGNSVYIDILVATDKKHADLVQDITSGKLNSLSMGCQSQFTICTKCGNVAYDDATLCPCITVDGKGSKFYDEDGIEHSVAELIGHVSVPNSNVFIEASWVHTPAFTGAVRRNVLNDDDEKLAALIESAQASKVIPNIGGTRKRANLVTKVSAEDSMPAGPAEAAPTPPEEAASEPKDVPDADDPPGKSLDALQDLFKSAPSTGNEEPAGAESGVTAPGIGETPDTEGKTPDADAPGDEKPGKAEGDKLDRVVGKIEDSIIDAVIKKIEERFNPKPEDVGSVMITTPSVEAQNENLVTASMIAQAVLKDDAFASDLKSIADRLLVSVSRTASGGRLKDVTHRDMLVLLWAIDKRKGREYPTSLYKVAMKVGSMAQYPSRTAFLASAKMQLGRALTPADVAFFIEKSELTSIAGF